MDRRGLIRFFKYVGVGVSTFGLDLMLLFLLVDGLDWVPTFAAALAFLLAVSINYAISRSLVFRHSTRAVWGGYAGFLAIAGTGLFLVTVSMHLLTVVYEVQYLLARVAVAGVTGLWNYLLNLYVNFRVAGIHG